MPNRTKTKLLFAATLAGAILAFGLPAEAGRGWHRGNNYYQFQDLRRACHWGDRWACIEMGKIIGQRRETQRRYLYSERHRFPGYGWNYPDWSRPPPPPGFFFRFEGR